ncbi:hypothetical protein, partial [Rhizobium leguminosarum]|uniref:hypothetical protein n=1 Tax=Rhizobium leguminosarum TaxID=384 RepID=UPI003F96D955
QLEHVHHNPQDHTQDQPQPQRNQHHNEHNLTPHLNNTQTLEKINKSEDNNNQKHSNINISRKH